MFFLGLVIGSWLQSTLVIILCCSNCPIFGSYVFSSSWQTLVVFGSVLAFWKRGCPGLSCIFPASKLGLIHFFLSDLLFYLINIQKIILLSIQLFEPETWKSFLMPLTPLAPTCSQSPNPLGSTYREKSQCDTLLVQATIIFHSYKWNNLLIEFSISFFTPFNPCPPAFEE